MEKQMSWFTVLIWLPILLVLMVMTKLLWGKWEKKSFEKVTNMMKNTAK